MIIPTSLERIRPFPVLAISILHRIPLDAAAGWEIDDLLQDQDELESEMSTVAERCGLAADLSMLSAPVRTEIALTLLVSGYMRANRSPASALHRTEHRKYWRFTLASAIACSELGAARDVNATLAYAGGLLHDIGRLALITAFPDKYANLLTLANRMLNSGEAFSLPEYERTLFGLDRFETAQWLGSTWDLPASIRLIAGKFGQDAPPQEKMLVSAVRDGTRLAHALGYGYMETSPQSRRADVVHLLSLKEYRGRFTAESISRTIDRQLQCYPIEPDSVRPAGSDPRP